MINKYNILPILLTVLLTVIMFAIITKYSECKVYFYTISGFEIESSARTPNGRCKYTIKCERPILSCAPTFYDECKYKVGDTLYLTLRKENER